MLEFQFRMVDVGYELFWFNISIIYFVFGFPLIYELMGLASNSYTSATETCWTVARSSII